VHADTARFIFWKFINFFYCLLASLIENFLKVYFHFEPCNYLPQFCLVAMKDKLDKINKNFLYFLSTWYYCQGDFKEG
jgi:hypothetical protein